MPLIAVLGQVLATAEAVAALVIGLVAALQAIDLILDHVRQLRGR